MTDLVPVPNRKFRRTIPQAHRSSLDSRIAWLWNQRFGTVQQIYKDSPDILDQTASILILQAIMAKDLQSISQIFQRLEGSPITDEQLVEKINSVRI